MYHHSNQPGRNLPAWSGMNRGDRDLSRDTSRVYYTVLTRDIICAAIESASSSERVVERGLALEGWSQKEGATSAKAKVTPEVFEILKHSSHRHLESPTNFSWNMMTEGQKLLIQIPARREEEGNVDGQFSILITSSPRPYRESELRPLVQSFLRGATGQTVANLLLSGDRLEPERTPIFSAYVDDHAYNRMLYLAPIPSQPIMSPLVPNIKYSVWTRAIAAPNVVATWPETWIVKLRDRASDVDFKCQVTFKPFSQVPPAASLRHPVIPTLPTSVNQHYDYYRQSLAYREIPSESGLRQSGFPSYPQGHDQMDWTRESDSLGKSERAHRSRLHFRNIYDDADYHSDSGSDAE